MDNIYKALGLFIETIREYVVTKLTEKAGDQWPAEYRSLLLPNQQTEWDRGIQNGTPPKILIDYHNLKGFALKKKDLFRPDFGKSTNHLVTWIDEIAHLRNQTTHFKKVQDEEVQRAFLNMKKILAILNLNDAKSAIISCFEDQKPPEESRNPKLATTSAGMVPWFRNVKPHLDIRQGHLDESVFAANLSEVALGSGREIYQNPALFFSKTFFTLNLKNVARLVIQGLNGIEEGENRVMSLQTGFGGGKTHTLITLFHLAKWGSRSAHSQELKDLIAFTGTPNFDSANIAVFTNTTNDPTQGRETENIQIKTLWGELAWQLGGLDAYEIIRANDENRTAPKGLFKKVLEKCQPSLILIDELADYCVAASGISVGASSLSDQTISFMQELTEAVSTTDKVVMVATLPASVAEVANSESAARILHSLEQRIIRVGADTKPVSDEEIFEVIRRRLFEDLGTDAIREHVISGYIQMYQELASEIPDYASRSQFKENLRKSYPFHPELIDIFRIRWASNPDFQRTRGVLRLLAAIVADLWKRRDTLTGVNALIHTGDIRFVNLDSLSGQLKKLYGNGYDAVITADVSGSSSNAAKIDDEKPEYGQHYLTQGVASTILLGSFGSTGANQGISTKEIKLCLLKPGSFNHNSINGTLDELEGNAHYLHYSTSPRIRRYWFHTKPNLNILINQARSDISTNDVQKEIVEHLELSRKRVKSFEVLVAPSGDIPERRRITLIFLHPKYQISGGNIPKFLRERVEKIATQKGNSDRLYRNTILFLACSEISYSKLKDNVTEMLACKRIQEDYFTQFGIDQKNEIKKKLEGFEYSIARDVATCYSIILKYSSSSKNIDRLDLRSHKDTLSDQVNTSMSELLQEEEWIIPSVGMGLLRKNNLIPQTEKPIQVSTIWEAFLRYDDKPMLINKQVVHDSLIKYCFDGEFAIASGQPDHFSRFYFKDDRPTFFDVEDENYWLVHKNNYLTSLSTHSSSPANNTSSGLSESLTAFESASERYGIENKNTPSSVSEKEIRSLKVSGKVLVEQWATLFSSLIRPLIDNDVEIFVEIKGRSKKSVPLTDTSQSYKVVKESAAQLGLDFEENRE